MSYKHNRQVDKNHPSFFVDLLLWKQAHRREQSVDNQEVKVQWITVEYCVVGRKTAGKYVSLCKIFNNL